jgi:hypothetical protein
MKSYGKKRICLIFFLGIIGLMLGFSGCDDSDDETVNNPFVWPTVEFLNNKVILGGGMDTPRSIIYDTQGGPGSRDAYFYISNRGDTGGTGFISRVASQLTTPTTWVQDQNITTPRGMALDTDANRLMVVNGTNVVVIDTTDGSVVSTIAVANAVQLKDIVYNNEDGFYYASDDQAKRIFRGKHWETTAATYRTLTTYDEIGGLELSEDGDTLYIGCKNKLLRVNIAGDGDVTELIDSLGQDFVVDGITRIYGSMFVVCDTTQRLIWAIDLLGQHSQLSQLNQGFSPSDVMAYKDTDSTWYLYVPTLEGNQVNVYKIVSG